MPLLDWRPVLSELELEVMRPTDDVIHLWTRWVSPALGLGSTDEDMVTMRSTTMLLRGQDEDGWLRGSV